jgi:hypothetical protein
VKSYRKFFVAIVAPVVIAVLPFFQNGWSNQNIGPLIVAVLVALGVYTVPNEPNVARRRSTSQH